MRWTVILCAALLCGGAARPVAAFDEDAFCPDFGRMTLDLPRQIMVSGRLVRTCYGLEGDVDAVSATTIIVSEGAVPLEVAEPWPLFILSGGATGLGVRDRLRLVTRPQGNVVLAGTQYEVRGWTGAAEAEAGYVMHLVAEAGAWPAHMVTLSFDAAVSDPLSPTWTDVRQVVVSIFDGAHQLTRMRDGMLGDTPFGPEAMAAMVRDLTRVLAWADGQ